MTVKTIAIENARIGFKNFSGKEGKFNPPGRKNFCVFLELDDAKSLEKEGWNVRWLEAREDDDHDVPILQVTVNYDNIPPTVMLISSKGKTYLDDESVSILDWADIQYIDLIINPYEWEVNGKRGVKAYLKSMYVTITEDEFASKYNDVPDTFFND